MKIAWSDIAEADLDDLYDYIAHDVPHYAEQFTSRLIDAVATLTDHPDIGRHVPEAEERNDIRERAAIRVVNQSRFGHLARRVRIGLFCESDDGDGAIGADPESRQKPFRPGCR